MFVLDLFCFAFVFISSFLFLSFLLHLSECEICLICFSFCFVLYLFYFGGFEKVPLQTFPPPSPSGDVIPDLLEMTLEETSLNDEVFWDF